MRGSAHRPSNIDLDDATEIIESRWDRWVELGLTPHPIAWMDNDVAWPHPIVTTRSTIVRPMSLGLRIEGAEGNEGMLVLYAGGWADTDVILAVTQEVISEYVELEDAREFAALLDRVVARVVAG